MSNIKRKYPAWASVLSVLAGFCLLLILFLMSFKVTVFNPSYAHRELEKYGVSGKTGISQEEINALFDRMLDYLEGRADSMQMEITQQGEVVQAYSEKELLHMEDVQKLFAGGFQILYFCIGIDGVLFLFLLFYKNKNGRVYPVLFRGVLVASLLFVVLVAVLGLALAFNFDEAFVLFHKMFFTNDLWILDYNTDVLMNIVPETYSFDVALRTVVTFVIVFVPLILGCWIGWRRKRVEKCKQY